jgi:AraC family transcriptional regulator, transcriptional activator of pobA
MDVAPENLYFSTMWSFPRSHASQRRTTFAGPIPAFSLYGEPLRPPDERLIHVETIAARSSLYNWTIGAHRHHDLNQILLVYRGHVVARLDDRSFSLDAPLLVVVPPATVHSFMFQSATDGLVVSFAPGLIAEFRTEGDGIAAFLEHATARSLIPREVRRTDLQRLGTMLLREFTRFAPGRQAALQGLLSALLANVLRLARQSTDENASAMSLERELVAHFRRLIEERYRTHAAVGAYANELGVSESKLRRACLTVAGQSPTELLHLRLLVEAERQLRYTTLSIAEVAYHLGFEDPAYFTRFFTRRLQVSPRTFRLAAPPPARS